MAGLVPAIHVLLTETRKKDVDARDKRGHDESNNMRLGQTHHEWPLAQLDALRRVWSVFCQ
jgi:hypothetical protein